MSKTTIFECDKCGKREDNPYGLQDPAFEGAVTEDYTRVHHFCSATCLQEWLVPFVDREEALLAQQNIRGSR